VLVVAATVLSQDQKDSQQSEQFYTENETLQDSEKCFELLKDDEIVKNKWARKIGFAHQNKFRN